MSACLGYGAPLFGQTLVKTVSVSLSVFSSLSLFCPPQSYSLFLVLFSCLFLDQDHFFIILIFCLIITPSLFLFCYPSSHLLFTVFKFSLHPFKNTLIILLLFSLWQPWFSLFSCQVLLLNCVGAQCLTTPGPGCGFTLGRVTPSQAG